MEAKVLMIIESRSYGIYLRRLLQMRRSLRGIKFDLVASYNVEHLMDPNCGFEANYDFFLVFEGDRWTGNVRTFVIQDCKHHSRAAPIIWVQPSEGSGPPSELTLPEGSVVIKSDDPKHVLAQITKYIKAIEYEKRMDQWWNETSAQFRADEVERSTMLDEAFEACGLPPLNKI